MVKNEQVGLSLAVRAIKAADCDTVGDGALFARVDDCEQEVAVYRIEAEDGSGDGSELSVYAHRVWRDTFESVLQTRGAATVAHSD